MKLMLPSEHHAYLEVGAHRSHLSKVQVGLIIFGICVVLFGALDIARRVSVGGLNDDLLRTAFAPAATLTQ